jgi:hypothetical protein
MEQSLLRLAIIAFPMLLGSCVAVWGSSYQVESQTPEAMVVQYDTNFIDDAKIEKLANDHCQTYGKTALLQAHDKDMLNISTDNFLCQNPAPNPATAPE